MLLWNPYKAALLSSLLQLWVLRLKSPRHTATIHLQRFRLTIRISPFSVEPNST